MLCARKETHCKNPWTWAEVRKNISDYHSEDDKFAAKERTVEKVYSQTIESGDKIFQSVKKSTSTSAKILELFDPVQKFENCHECHGVHCNLSIIR